MSTKKQFVITKKEIYSSSNNENTIVLSIPDLQSRQIPAQSRSLVKGFRGRGGVDHSSWNQVALVVRSHKFEHDKTESTPAQNARRGTRNVPHPSA